MVQHGDAATHTLPTCIIIAILYILEPVKRPNKSDASGLQLMSVMSRLITNLVAGTDSGMCDPVRTSTYIISKVADRRSDGVEVPNNYILEQYIWQTSPQYSDTALISVLFEMHTYTSSLEDKLCILITSYEWPCELNVYPVDVIVLSDTFRVVLFASETCK